ncbi:Kelch repeat-containing protein [Pyxidicoccus xibeiensis]|uniref:Kelch repeat-containing protein n=1 Tax=Pyxidicoccus xibeiensis TaxID=2906759 RepID=UPI0020A7B769|nr:kelch repeat-containing protein [Pyxidicoccus xibeiensis]MCP3136551.1 kelch-like protein [Pyxidicoccus xibeiensis]
MQTQSRKQWALLCLMAAALSSFMGCGTPTEEPAATGAVQFAGSIPQALAGDDVTRVTVTLTATGVPSATTTLALSNGTWSGALYQLPAGSNRSFTAEAFNAEGALRYRGQATGVAIVSGETAVVAITLQSLDTSPPFDNTVPCIDSLVASASTVLPGGTIALRGTAHDPDASDTLTYAWSTTGGTFTTTGTATTTWTAPQTSGAFVLTLTVTDSRGASASINVSSTVISTDGGTAGSASVTVSFNTSPSVRGITVSRSPVPVGQSTTVTVNAVDGDADALSYQWTAACAGTWAGANTPSATFTPSAVPAGDPCGNCALTVAVTDPKGGRSQGTLRICVGPGTGASIPPRIILTNQSATSVAGGGSATLRVLAEDGDGSALTFGWSASTGTVGTPTNSFTSSEVRWTAPVCVLPGAAPTITATVTNARGFSASHTFSVSVLNGTECGSGTAAKWDTTGSMLTPRYGHSAVLLTTGKVLISGGYNPAMLASAELYSPDTGTWSAAGSMGRGRWGHTLTLLPSGRVLAIGGSTNTSGTDEVRNVDIYDPATNTWTAAAPLTFGRVKHTATLLPSGKVLVVGGYNADNSVARIPELYDPATDSWVPVTSMAATWRYSHVAVLLPSGKLLIAGGSTYGELYDAAMDSWTPATGLTGLSWTHAYLQPSGKVLLTAGTTLGLYDPALNTQTSPGALRHPRTDSTQVQLASGRLLITGGTQPISAITEVYDPATGATDFSVSMPAPRYGFPAVLLPSGKVLASGGHGAGNFLNTALLYTP